MDSKMVLKPEEKILLVMTNSANYAETATNLTKLFSKSGSGIYVSVNKPFETLKQSFIRNKIKVNSIFFIDMVTKTNDARKDSNCLYLGNPGDLTSVSIAIDQVLSSIEGEKFVIFDTINTLLNYNNESMVIRFMHALVSKIRNENARGILLSVGNLKEGMESQLTQFCDKNITV